MATEAGANTCGISSRLLPKNESNTCWWLSANLALFHKHRPELDAYVAVTESPPQSNGSPSQFGSNLKQGFKTIYEYYSSGTLLEGIDEQSNVNLLVTARTADGMSNAFTTSNFDVAGSNAQSSDDYITKLSGYIGLDHGLLPINSGAATGILETDGYDINIHAQHFGIPLDDSSNIKHEFQVGSEVQTLILTFGRKGTDGKTDIPIQPLETIKIPTINGSNLTPDEKTALTSNVTSNINFAATPYKGSNLRMYTEIATFYLDAMIVYEPDHYVSYVKCDTSWYYYKAINKGTLSNSTAGNKTFSNFDHMMTEHARIKENFTHLFYSKVTPP